MIVRILLLTLLAHGAQAQCPAHPKEVELAGEEFTVEGYDAEAQMLAIRPRMFLRAQPARAAIQFAALDRPLVMATTPSQLNEIIEAQRSGELRFVMRVRPAPGPQASDGCGSWEPSPVALQARGEIIVGTTEDAGVAPPAPKPPPDAVEIGAIRFGRTTPKFRTRGMAYHVAAVARSCLHKAELQGSASTGAVILELRTTLAGLPKLPTRVVDGLVNRMLSDCLIDQLFERSATWHDAPPGAQVFVPVYFWPGRPSSAGPDASGLKAP